jgi:nucleoid DNA-binding protein
MKKSDLAKKLARRSQSTTAVAADQIDRAVHEILRRLRKGETVALPGLGTFEPGHLPAFRFLEPARKRTVRGKGGGEK